MSTPSESDCTPYRVTFLDKDGKVSSALVLFAPDDEEAKRKARAMVDGHGLDLWDGLRFIEYFPPIDPST